MQKRKKLLIGLGLLLASPVLTLLVIILNKWVLLAATITIILALFYLGISKKRILLGFLGAIGLVALPVVVLSIAFFARYSYVNATAKKECTDYLSTFQIPSEELIEINDNEPSGNILDWNPSSCKTVTTKEDVRAWQKIVKKSGTLLSGEKLPDENYLNDPKNCEITYNFSYHINKFSGKWAVDFFLHYGNKLPSEKEFIQEHFAITPPEKAMKYLQETY
ncbi:hypothetical protein SAMN02745116_00892 [Pilibacter termitis]|uniref:Uncharacterized protein n=1 Tax=Pilibacter termitis TaxID=263852 RepID=A0A1T4M0Y6_9ENTE|nr:hypothetical protein [Pilibacter termitis]SJZ60384.1 hypothetical protein SAMN02745116_00892 [Pilibacter termitis]